jgi:hypothetical protein
MANTVNRWRCGWSPWAGTDRHSPERRNWYWLQRPIPQSAPLRFPPSGRTLTYAGPFTSCRCQKPKHIGAQKPLAQAFVENYLKSAQSICTVPPSNALIEVIVTYVVHHEVPAPHRVRGASSAVLACHQTHCRSFRSPARGRSSAPFQFRCAGSRYQPGFRRQECIR